jgi:hypothetical protein
MSVSHSGRSVFDRVSFRINHVLSERARVKPARVPARKDSSTRKNRLHGHGQTEARGIVMLLMFITVGARTKLSAGGGGEKWRTCAMGYDEPRPVWTRQSAGSFLLVVPNDCSLIVPFRPSFSFTWYWRYSAVES